MTPIVADGRMVLLWSSDMHGIHLRLYDDGHELMLIEFDAGVRGHVTGGISACPHHKEMVAIEPTEETIEQYKRRIAHADNKKYKSFTLDKTTSPIETIAAVVTKNSKAFRMIRDEQEERT